LLIIEGIGQALRETDATVVYVCNLVTKEGQTTDFTVSDHAKEIERFGGGDFLDVVLYNQAIPEASILERYHDENAYLVEVDDAELAGQAYTARGGNFLGEIAKRSKSDELLPVTRSLIRHNQHAVAAALMDIADDTL
jgi:uncharacterized cofD-like protein